MKALIVFIFVSIVAMFFLSSCSSQKRLQRRIERHGIKESIGFVINKYPEYFKAKDTIIHDTIIKFDSVVVPEIDTTLVLSDSSNFWVHTSDSLSIIVDKLTGKLKMNIKPRTIYIHDTVTVSIQCPEVICPDCDDLKDNTKEDNSFPWWLLILGGVLLGAFWIWSNRNVNN